MPAQHMTKLEDLQKTYSLLQDLMEEAPVDWEKSCVHTEDTVHQLSPYIGKLKSSIATYIIDNYSSENQIIVDPFAGSGTIPCQAVLMGRKTFASDPSIYAKILTKGKLSAPATEDEAIDRAKKMIKKASLLTCPDLADVPSWVTCFFHPKTLEEIIKFSMIARQSGNEFYFANFLGILHHQRPGFLSYPASHLTPYLRNKKYPRELYPEMYEYRDLASRLIAKIHRTYKRHTHVNGVWNFRQSSIENVTLPQAFDVLITSPPYMNTLDYGRDNRLRLWFANPYYRKSLDSSLTKSSYSFGVAMRIFAKKIELGLRSQGNCIIIVGEKAKGKIEFLSSLIVSILSEYAPSLVLKKVIVDKIPDIRRCRRNYQGTKNEHILIFQKR